MDTERIPTIVTLPPRAVAGLGFYGDPFRSHSGWTEENEIGRLWSRFMKAASDPHDPLRGLVEMGVMIEMHIWSEEVETTGEYEVFVGAFVSDAIASAGVKAFGGLPPAYSIKLLPAGEYAVYLLEGAEITSDWHSLIYNGWLKRSDYEPVQGFMYQQYDRRFKGIDRIEESALEAVFPVKRR